jgi:hypothetical protein
MAAGAPQPVVRRAGQRRAERKEGKKGRNEWENELESKWKKVGMGMETCCSNKLE